MAAISDDQRARILVMVENGMSRNAIVRETGVSAGSVSTIVKSAGGSFGERTEKMAAVTKTRKVELADKRALLELELLNDALKLRAQVWKSTDYQQAVGGQSPEVLHWTMAEPIPADKLKLIQAAGIAIDKSLKISDAAGDNGAEQAKSMLAGLAESLGAAWQAMKDTPEESTA